MRIWDRRFQASIPMWILLSQTTKRPIEARQRQNYAELSLFFSCALLIFLLITISRSCVPAKTTDSYRKDPERKRFHAYEEFGDRREGVVSSRTYFYEGEEQCDKNMKIFLDSIDGVSSATDKTGFCAIKLTALGRPQLLLQLSEVLMSMRGFFDKMLSSVGDLAVTKLREEQFLQALETLGIRISRDDSRMWFSILDITKDGEVDFLDWDNLLDDHFNLTKLFAVPEIKTKGPVTKLVSTLSKEQEQEMKNMLHRINTIAEYAREKDVRVMVDAEQTYFQPAISRLTMEMMRKFNKEKAIIFNTYQCYMKQANYNMKVDLDLSMREDFYFGAKLVRGAYMEQERERAKKIGYEDPIHPTFEATTAMYFRCVEEAMKRIKQREPGKIAIMIASHNEETVRYAVEKMKEYNILPSDRVICFGQLLGMCDQISFPLGQAGYSVYKYVPYGPVEEVLPYLSRRAIENRGVLKKVKKEKKLLVAEIRRRIKAGDWFYKPTPNTV
ncbi:hypothetical protein CHS0354_036512 [Potamilus streckersoni]|uniref:Proline dehydrogenase n=1 Tax=Potamilus streckersoni TaxID=2493646 RepID=A0AAE0S8K0_9BIVA|nr:hypothetical protein CHS0354_036512 [Potamilus streckersoni]